MNPKQLWEPKDIEFVFKSYLSFEERLLNVLKVIPYSEINKTSWSPDLASLFLDICGTIDSIARHIIGNGQDENTKVEVKKKDGSNYKKRIGDLNIDDYEVNLWEPMGLEKSWVVMYLYILYPNCAIAPYLDYRKSKGWWTIYNSLKHNRLNSYQEATLENTMKSLASLFLLLIRHKDKEFTKALIRFKLINKASYVPEFVHNMRLEHGSWCDTELFGTHDIPEKISSSDITKIEAYLGGEKFRDFIGRFNPATE